MEAMTEVVRSRVARGVPAVMSEMTGVGQAGASLCMTRRMGCSSSPPCFASSVCHSPRLGFSSSPCLRTLLGSRFATLAYVNGNERARVLTACSIVTDFYYQDGQKQEADERNAHQEAASRPWKELEGVQRRPSTVLVLPTTVELADLLESGDKRHIGNDDVPCEVSRRLKISMANKGRVPWNKGKRHRPETIERIRMKTAIAMRDPKVQEKLKMAQGHLHSAETRVKISQSLKQKWAAKRQQKGDEDACVKEWNESVAEAARKGGQGEDELQWGSYSLMKKLIVKEEVAGRKALRASRKTGKVARAPEHAVEHRLKISLAIRAKWADPEYRHKVSKGMEKSGRRSANPRARCTHPKPSTHEHPKPSTHKLKKSRVRKTSKIKNSVDDFFVSAVMAAEKRTEVRGAEQRSRSVSLVQRKTVARNGMLLSTKPGHYKNQGSKSGQHKNQSLFSEDEVTPGGECYADIASTYEKLQEFKQLQASHAMMQLKRQQATELAWMLMAEAERAAKALEDAASNDEFAMASLTEARKLMAEAAHYMQAAENVEGLGPVGKESGYRSCQQASGAEDNVNASEQKHFCRSSQKLSNSEGLLSETVNSYSYLNKVQMEQGFTTIACSQIPEFCYDYTPNSSNRSSSFGNENYSPMSSSNSLTSKVDDLNSQTKVPEGLEQPQSRRPARKWHKGILVAVKMDSG